MIPERLDVFIELALQVQPHVRHSIEHFNRFGMCIMLQQFECVRVYVKEKLRAHLPEEVIHVDLKHESVVLL